MTWMETTLHATAHLAMRLTAGLPTWGNGEGMCLERNDQSAAIRSARFALVTRQAVLPLPGSPYQDDHSW